jgi:hypothetical protein
MASTYSASVGSNLTIGSVFSKYGPALQKKKQKKNYLRQIKKQNLRQIFIYQDPIQLFFQVHLFDDQHSQKYERLYNLIIKFK